ncbi:MAG: VanZ family protein [Thermoanaerobaculales bacterium]
MRTRKQSHEPGSELAQRDGRPERRWSHLNLWYANAVYATLLAIGGLSPGIPAGVGLLTDTWSHSLAYGVQAILLFLVLSDPFPPVRAAWLSFLGASGFGAGVELLQFFQPAREVEFADLIANTGGALAASLLSLALRHWSVRWRKAGGE